MIWIWSLFFLHILSHMCLGEAHILFHELHPYEHYGVIYLFIGTKNMTFKQIAVN